jgi:TRAP-type C4-dicarboxylate transport system permease small subunit
MSTIVTLIRRVDATVAMGVANAASLALAVAALASFWQVMGRFVFQVPSTWSEALTRVALIWMVMLGISTALRAGAFVAIDLVRDALHGRLRLALELAITLACLFLFAMLFWLGWEIALRVQRQEMAGLGISMSWGYTAIPVGSAFAALGVLAHFLQNAKRIAS